MHKIFRNIAFAALALSGLAVASCDNTKSYAELLDDENHYVNMYLADQRVVPDIPKDTIFEVGPNAPFYRLDEDGNLYMQVLNAGTPGNKAEADELIYFRFTRYSLYGYKGGELSNGIGNETDMSFNDCSFRFGNYQLQSSSQWGSGIQYPLALLPIDCEVNLIVKSQLGLTQEIAEVVPYLYHLRYYRPKI
ncbi:MAG: DUF4827 domain-containing protein [Muribaculaceae bacterium]|nr:DUF4827 domain-containing protein [Muribaculaceae bacterium]